MIARQPARHTLHAALLIALLCCYALALAQEPAPIELTADRDNQALFNRAYLFEDASTTLPIEAVRQPDKAPAFTHSGAYSSSQAPTLWAHFTVVNRSDSVRTWWLDTGNRVSQEFDVYTFEGAKQLSHQRASSNLPFSARPLPTANFVFPLVLPPNQAIDIYLRVRTTSPVLMSLAPTLWQPDAYQKMARNETLQWIAYAGVCAALGLLNLMLWGFLRDAQYGWYVGALGGVFMSVSFTAGGYGAAHEFLTPNSPVLHQVLMPFSWLLGVSMQFAFVMRLLNISLIAPHLLRVSRMLLVMTWLGALLRTLAIALGSATVTALAIGMNPLLAIGVSGVVICLIYSFVLALYRGVPLAAYVLVAFVPYMLYGAWGVLAGNLLGITMDWSFMMWGSVFEMLVMSLALADRFHREQQQKMLALSEQERLSRLRRFFSPAVADRLLSDNAEDFLKPRRREIVVVFVDLRGYTAFTDTHEADEVMRVLGEFHEAMGEIIMAHGGTLERFAGDGLMIFFNDPIEIDDPAQQAVAMAVAMQRRFAELQTLWQSRGYTLAMGIGIAQGVATLGAIGFEGRRDYGAIGGVTNLAARLCGEAKGGQILLSESVATLVAQRVPVQPVGSLTLKGFVLPQATFSITSGTH